MSSPSSTATRDSTAVFLDIRWDKETKRHTGQPILNQIRLIQKQNYMLMKHLVGYHLHQVDVICMFMFPVLYLVVFRAAVMLSTQKMRSRRDTQRREIPRANLWITQAPVGLPKNQARWMKMPLSIPPSIPPSPVPSRSTHSPSAMSVSGAYTADLPKYETHHYHVYRPWSWGSYCSKCIVGVDGESEDGILNKR